MQQVDVWLRVDSRQTKYFSDTTSDLFYEFDLSKKSVHQIGYSRYMNTTEINCCFLNLEALPTDNEIL